MKKTLLSTAALSLLIIPTQSFGAVTGQCGNCHTMHNSQSSQAVNDPTGPHNGGTYATLLKNGCVGCHSSDVSSTTYMLGTSRVPVVNYLGGAPSEHLAGGNFWWVADGGGDDDAKGHNVLGISGQDLAITALEGAPGDSYGSGCLNSCHKTLAIEQTDLPSFDMGSGCQGCHMDVAHHADDSATVAGATGGWYRFLTGHMSANSSGVVGIEDADWEATKGSSDHNEYLGLAMGYTGSQSLSVSGGTMTSYCLGCHNTFHTQNTESDGSGVWIRHPSDAVIPSTGEYAGYVSYDPLVPVARENFTGYTGASDLVTPGEDMVMCLSCHRPHGSPYDDILRWDYTEMDAGTTGMYAGSGCFKCHSEKDGS